MDSLPTVVNVVVHSRWGVLYVVVQCVYMHTHTCGCFIRPVMSVLCAGVVS